MQIIDVSAYDGYFAIICLGLAYVFVFRNGEAELATVEFHVEFYSLQFLFDGWIAKTIFEILKNVSHRTFHERLIMLHVNMLE